MTGRAVVTWAGPGEPIMLTLYGPDGEVAVSLKPTRGVVWLSSNPVLVMNNWG